MGTQTAYACDGPKCEVLTTRTPGSRYPEHWERISYRNVDGVTVTGAFHAAECGHGWLDERMPIVIEEAEKQTPPSPTRSEKPKKDEF